MSAPVVINTTITVPEDVTVGTPLTGSVSFDIASDVKVTDVVIKLQAIEFGVIVEHHEPSLLQKLRARRVQFLQKYQKDGKAPEGAEAEAYDSYYPFLVKFEFVKPLLENNDAVLAAGVQKFEFEFNIPEKAPATSALSDDLGDVDVILYRLVAYVKSAEDDLGVAIAAFNVNNAIEA
ncbi:hypothetical protein BC830DRAFT_1135493 [Chytriomyces sp. MP71]|nr:hypothetical protein BC830DRAFT_1135493 [Chytriomyces sp. MP71]